MNRVRVTVDDLRKAAESEVRSTWSAAQWMRWLDAAAMLHGHSFRNIVLIKLQMPEASWVAEREVWQRGGWRVARKASGIRIIAAARPHAVDLMTGSVQGHGVATVWDVSQTVGRPVPQRDVQASAEMAPQRLCSALAQVASDAGFTLSREPLPPHAGESAINYARRRITVDQDLDEVSAVARIAHELAHIRLHKPAHSAGAAPCVGLGKVEAESVAYVLLSRFGVPADGASSGAVHAAQMIRNHHPEQVVQTLGGRVVAAAERLMNATEQYLLQPPTGHIPARRAPFTRQSALPGRDYLPPEPGGTSPGSSQMV